MSGLMRRLDAYWMAPAPARRLALLRILIGGFALLYVGIGGAHIASVATFSAEQFEPVGLVRLLGAPLAAPAARALVAVTFVTGLAFVGGWRFRISGPMFAVLLLWIITYRNSWGQIFHTENLLVLHVAVLALAPSADALSLDARRRPVHGAPVPRARYGWPVRLMARDGAGVCDRRTDEAGDGRAGLDHQRRAAQPDRVRQPAQDPAGRRPLAAGRGAGPARLAVPAPGGRDDRAGVGGAAGAAGRARRTGLGGGAPCSCTGASSRSWRSLSRIRCWVWLSSPSSPSSAGASQPPCGGARQRPVRARWAPAAEWDTVPLLPERESRLSTGATRCGTAQTP